MPIATDAAVKTVIVADDTAFVRDRFKAAIEEAGHRALTAGSTAELLDHIRAGPAQISLVLLDLRLGNASGVDMVRAIRDIGGGKVPILVFTGTIANTREVHALAELGIAGYINEYSAPRHILPGLSPHLFPGSPNRRGSPRFALGLPIVYRFGNTIASAIMRDISSGGLALRTTRLLDNGTSIRVRFRLPGTSRELDIAARVQWGDSRVGMGVQFDGITDDDQRIVDDFVNRHFFTNRKA